MMCAQESNSIGKRATVASFPVQKIMEHDMPRPRCISQDGDGGATTDPSGLFAEPEAESEPEAERNEHRMLLASRRGNSASEQLPGGQVAAAHEQSQLKVTSRSAAVENSDDEGDEEETGGKDRETRRKAQKLKREIANMEWMRRKEEQEREQRVWRQTERERVRYDKKPISPAGTNAERVNERKRSLAEETRGRADRSESRDRSREGGGSMRRRRDKAAAKEPKRGSDSTSDSSDDDLDLSEIKPSRPKLQSAWLERSANNLPGVSAQRPQRQAGSHRNLSGSTPGERRPTRKQSATERSRSTSHTKRKETGDRKQSDSSSKPPTSSRSHIMRSITRPVMDRDDDLPVPSGSRTARESRTPSSADVRRHSRSNSADDPALKRLLSSSAPVVTVIAGNNNNATPISSSSNLVPTSPSGESAWKKSSKPLSSPRKGNIERT